MSAMVLACAMSLTLPLAAHAHFQMLYPGESARSANSGALDFLVIFTHPFNGRPSMNMGPPRALYMLRQRGGEGKVQKTDLLGQLAKFDWMGAESAPVTAYRFSLPSEQVRSLGDYVFVLEPEPYLEGGEEKYIQQFTKTIVNVGGLPGNWDRLVGLPAEIRPLSKPYANWTNGVFRGVVLGAGKPVPFAEVEVEFVNRKPDGVAGVWSGDPQVRVPQPALGPMSIRADATGAFTIGLPRAGWWGVAALDVGPVKKFKGKKLSQDAVIWVQVTDIK